MKISSKKIQLLIGAVIVALSAFVLISVNTAGSNQPKDVTLVTHDSFVMSTSLINEFDTQSGYNLKVISSGDAGALTNRLILTKGAPIADAVFGIDNTLSGEAYAHSLIAGSLTATDFGDVCFNYDKFWFAAPVTVSPFGGMNLTSPAWGCAASCEDSAR